MGGSSGVLLSRTRAASFTSKSQENGFKKCTRGKAGMRATCSQRGGRGRRRRRGQLKQQAVPRLRCQNSSRRGLNYRLCANTPRGCRDQLPSFDEADRAERKTERGEKQHMAIRLDLLAKRAPAPAGTRGSFASGSSESKSGAQGTGVVFWHTGR